MLDPQFKKRWLEALRSGEYEQGRHHLCFLTLAGAKYCCLGVAAEVLEGEDAWEPPGVLFDSGAGVLSIDKQTGVFYPPGMEAPVIHCLMGMNDNGYSFAAIADYIEANC